MIDTKEVNGVKVLKVGEGPNILLLHSTGMPPQGLETHLKLLAPFFSVSALIYLISSKSLELGILNP